MINSNKSVVCSTNNISRDNLLVSVILGDYQKDQLNKHP